MKRMMNFVNALIVIALTLTSCSDEGTGRRPDTNPQQPPQQETTFQVNPDWTLSHNREVITDENGFRADVDVITVRSLDQETYWLDVLTSRTSITASCTREQTTYSSTGCVPESGLR